MQLWYIRKEWVTVTDLGYPFEGLIGKPIMFKLFGLI